MKRFMVGATVCSLVLVGCTGGGAPTVTVRASPTATAAPTPSTTPTPTATAPVLLTRAEAAALYLKIVEPGNTLADTKTPPSNSQHLAAWKKYEGEVATAERTLTSALVVAPWPTDVEPLAQKLAAESATSETCAASMAAARTWTAFVQDSYASTCNETSATAELIRVHLGLPNVKP